jgi:hypothetical protein
MKYKRTYIFILLIAQVFAISTLTFCAVATSDASTANKLKSDQNLPPAIDFPTTLTKNLISFIHTNQKLSGNWNEIQDGVNIQDVVKGRGRPIQKDLLLLLQLKSYTEDGVESVNTVNERTPLRYLYGNGLLPIEFDKAIASMKPGGRRLIIFTKDVIEKIEIESFERRMFIPGKHLIIDVYLLWVRDNDHDKINKFR